ncbi:MAG: MFS transporter [Deltaproteobacteria bacterium]|nr:MFS transporter [Deltaproteobacteria bacterium]
MAASEETATSTQPAEFAASEGYKQYVVWLLFVVYVFNFVDRQILSIVIEPIKREFGLHDWELGVLSGLAFAVLYSTLGIPIARLADRRSRVDIIVLSLFVWSSFTALTGFARSFWHLLLARVGVGIGEAGCSPPAYSLISDYVEPGKRATALSIYSMGVYGGGALGFLIGGHVAQVHGWRMAFFVCGLPGILLGLLVKATLREPPRGFSEGTHRVIEEPPPFLQVVARLWSKRSFKHLSFAGGLHAFVSYGVATFYASYLGRTHGMAPQEIGAWLALVTFVGGFAGTYGGVKISDHYFAKKPDPRYYLWVPAITLILNVPFGVILFGFASKQVVLWMLIPTIALSAAYLAPSIATTHRLVGLRERAVAGAVLLFVLNLIGLGLGPMCTGILSDRLRAHFLEQGMVDTQATADGLKWALTIASSINLWSALHYYLAARTLNQDIESGNQQRA